jgi:hypothetical protein
MLNSFQRWALPRLKNNGFIALPTGNWVTAFDVNGDQVSIMTYSGVTSFILDNREAETCC